MTAEGLRKNFSGRMLGAGLAGLTALTPLTGSAQEATPTVMTHDQEIAEFGEAMNAAEDYARLNNSVAILFHIGDDVRSREDGAEIMARVEAHIEQQFAALGIAAESFSSANLGAQATGLTYYYGNNVYVNADGAIDLDLQQGLDAIPSVAENLNLYLQTIQARAELSESPEPQVGG